MKRIPSLTTLTAFVALWTMAVFGLVPSEAEGAVPQLINFQGILRDGSGNPVADGSYSVIFTIYDAPSGGTNLWTESQTVNTIGGLFTVNLGSLTPLGDAVFSGATRYLGIKVGADPEMSPRTALVSVPYAHRIATVDGATAGTVTGNLVITNKTRIGPGTSNAGVNAFSVGANNAADDSAAVALGRNNKARGKFSVVSGGGGSDLADSNAALGDYSVVGGGRGNLAAEMSATVGGGENNRASDVNGTVAGGSGNHANAANATVGGGQNDTASGTNAVVGGGIVNVASNLNATVSGGLGNRASGSRSTVGGGSNNWSNGPFATTSGGDLNSAFGAYATVGGGSNNAASSDSGTIAGGAHNSITGIGATVGGGSNNRAFTANFTTIGGGRNNFVNSANATVGGGLDNTASGSSSTVPGGQENAAIGNYSLAAGLRAQANHAGSFVWADGTGAYFVSTAANQFLIRASGGVGIGTSSPVAQLQVDGGDIFIGTVSTPASPGSKSIFLENTNGDQNNSFRIDGDGNQLYVIASSTGGAAVGAGIKFRTGDASGGEIDRMAITPVGSVGIGTNTPITKLQVVGDIRVGTGGTNGCVQRFDGVSIAGTCASDRRLKKDIEPFPPLLEKLARLEPVSFDWKKEEYPQFNLPSVRTNGLVAQEVEKILPELVTTDENGFKAIHYHELPLMLLQAIKEQQKEIEALKKEIAKLKNQPSQARVEK